MQTDTCAYALLCPPCAFGHNVAKLDKMSGDPYPNCHKYCIMYTMYYVSGAITGASLMTLAGAGATSTATQIGTQACAQVTLGAYASKHRKRIRDTFGIPSVCDDCVAYSLCSSCAVMEESIIMSSAAEDGAVCYRSPPDNMRMMRE